jgi:hypothetical protein
MTDYKTFPTIRAKLIRLTAPFAGDGLDEDIKEHSSTRGELGPGRGGPRPSRLVTLRGSKIDKYFNENGETKAPSDLSATPLRAIVPDGAGGFTIHPGSGDAAGRFTIPDVPLPPNGHYYLSTGTKTQVITRHTEVDLGADQAGRAGARFPSGPTPVTFHVSGLAPWEDDNDLQFFSPTANGWLPVSGAFANPLGPGDTSTHSLTVDWRDPLVDTSAGDTAYLFQLTFKLSTTGTRYVAATRSLQASVAMVDQIGGDIAGVLEPVSQDQSATVHFRIAGVEQLRSAMNPNAYPLDHALIIATRPGVSEFGGPLPDILIVSAGAATDDQDLGTMTYGNPFPADWGLLFIHTHLYGVDYLLPGTNRPRTLVAAIDDRDTALRSDLGPVLGPVTNPRVNGLDAFADQSGVGTTPRLSWDPPALGSPNGFQVDVRQLLAVGNRTVDRPIVRFLTRDSAIQIPPDFVQPGQAYVFTIVARSGDVDASHHPNRVSTPFAVASCLTGIIRP